MSLFKKLFGKREEKLESISTFADFWNWFRNKEQQLHQKYAGNVLSEDFIDSIYEKLNQVAPGLYILAGEQNDGTYELIITADSNVKNFSLAKDVVDAAPNIKGWCFSHLKQSCPIGDFTIEIRGEVFDTNKMKFYANNCNDFQDLIDITVIHADMNDDNAEAIIQGVELFLENALGESEFASAIDVLSVKGSTDIGEELIPLEKLPIYLEWRKKEFLEKYIGTRYNTQNDEYSIYEVPVQDGSILLATLNATLLKWDAKASHPWILEIEIPYDGLNTNGMPDNKTSVLLNDMEDVLMEELKDSDGYLNVGRYTFDSKRIVFFACKEVYHPSRVARVFAAKNNDFDITFDLYKDKYWRVFDQFIN